MALDSLLVSKRLSWGLNTQEKQNKRKEKGFKLCIQNQRKKGEGKKKASPSFEKLQVYFQRVLREEVAGIYTGHRLKTRATEVNSALNQAILNRVI